MAITLPYDDFTPGAVISSAQVDANFDALKNGAVDKTGDTLTGGLSTLGLTPTVTGLHGLGTTSLRYADAYLSGGLYASGRTTAAGVWTSEAYNAAHFTASSGSWTVASGDMALNQYMVIGNTLFWNLVVGTSSVTATPATLSITYPGGFTSSTTPHVRIAYCNDNGTIRDAAYGACGASSIAISNGSGGNWNTSTDGTYVYFQIFLQII